MNSNERPGGYLRPELAPPIDLIEGVRPFVQRRSPVRVPNPNHIQPPLVAGEPRPLPDDWCYRCDAPGHEGEYACWVPIRPIPTDQAVATAAIAARSASGVPMALANWTPEHEALIAQVAEALLSAVAGSRRAREHFAARYALDRVLEEPLEDGDR